MKNFFAKSAQTSLVMCCVLVFSLLFTACNDGGSIKHDPPINVKKLKAHLISIDQAVDGYKRYSTERIALSQDTLKSLYGNEFNDTRMVRFDLETIKSYIAYVEKKSATKGIKPEGLQFYFSVHSKSGNQPNQQSFFIAPTVENEGTQSGYTIVKKGDSTEVMYLKALLKGRGNYSSVSNQLGTISKASLVNFFQEDTLEGLIINMGSGTPPGE